MTCECNEVDGVVISLCLAHREAFAKSMEAEYARTYATPVQLILTCPSCNARHIDTGEFATKPHHTHACQSCGMVWRPALVSTVGVQFLPGYKNEEVTARRQQAVETICVTCGKPPSFQCREHYVAEITRLARERDEARGKAAYMIEAFWLAIADLGHSDECDITTCSHQQPVCDHVNVDCTCPERACECECSCWRAAADKVTKIDEAVQLCTTLRDAEDEIESLKVMLARMFAWAVLGREGREADITWLRDYNAVRAKLGKKEGEL